MVKTPYIKPSSPLMRAPYDPYILLTMAHMVQHLIWNKQSTINRQTGKPTNNATSKNSEGPHKTKGTLAVLGSPAEIMVVAIRYIKTTNIDSKTVFKQWSREL